METFDTDFLCPFCGGHIDRCEFYDPYISIEDSYTCWSCDISWYSPEEIETCSKDRAAWMREHLARGDMETFIRSDRFLRLIREGI